MKSLFVQATIEISHVLKMEIYIISYPTSNVTKSCIVTLTLTAFQKKRGASWTFFPWYFEEILEIMLIFKIIEIFNDENNPLFESSEQRNYKSSLN